MAMHHFDIDVSTVWVAWLLLARYIDSRLLLCVMARESARQTAHLAEATLVMYSWVSQTWNDFNEYKRVYVFWRLEIKDKHRENHFCLSQVFMRSLKIQDFTPLGFPFR